MTRRAFLLLTPLVLLLGGCDWVVMDPAGDIAARQRDLLVWSTVLMLLIIVPVMALTALFAWRYRAANTAARYEPDWDHSTKLELVIWTAPLLIIICLGALTWLDTHLLDPYRPLDRLGPGRPIAAQTAEKPLTVNVVALDWKWLFIYPEYGIATVNELAAPVDRPIEFHITSSSVMNSFYIPALAGQIYAMPGMRTRLHAVINRAGSYTGFSANYSGAGFSGMRFAFHGMPNAEFDRWRTSVQAAGGMLDRTAYGRLEQPSENEPVRHYGAVDPGLFEAVINLCVDSGTMCMSDMMRYDADGGLERDSAWNVLPLPYDKFSRRGAVFGEPSFVANICAVEPAPAASRPPAAVAATAQPRDQAPLRGAALPRPGAPKPWHLAGDERLPSLSIKF